MVKFANNSIYTNKGDPIHILYSPIVNDDGSIELKESGKENTDEIIQSYAESTDIHVILARYAAGDLDVLNQRKAMYGDFTQMPKTFAEVLQLQIDSRNLFNSLDIDTRNKFNNDPNEFFARAGSKEWFDLLGVSPDIGPIVKDPVIEESKEGEVKE